MTFVFNYPTNIKPYFETVNYFKDICKLFSKVLKIKEKKTAANSSYTAIAIQRLSQRNLQLRVAANRYRQAWQSNPYYSFR
jgi:hypothetical protein